MSRVAAIILIVFVPGFAFAQSIFAHNDYVKPKPFQNAYKLKAKYIEADVFLRDRDLLVAHTRAEIHRSKTLRKMYLDPLSEKIDSLYSLTLMIDLKTDGVPTLDALVRILDEYPRLTHSNKLSITVSGGYPSPEEWENYPLFIHFDGRPGIEYTPDQLDRIPLISTSYGSVSSWDGKGEIPPDELKKLKDVIDEVHKLGKPIRLWASPDFENAWEKFSTIGIDILNSDHIDELSKYLANH